MNDKPYNLNQHSDSLLREVMRRIEEQLQCNGVMVKFDNLPAVEQLIDQYNTELAKVWDKSSAEYIQHEKKRIVNENRVTSLEALLRWGVRMVRNPGQPLERQQWIDDVSAVLPEGKVD